MSHYLWELHPYFRQVARMLAIGSLAGIIMNTAIVLLAILLGRMTDSALAVAQGNAVPSELGWAAALFVVGMLLTEGPRIIKRWWLITANARIRTSLRADVLRGDAGCLQARAGPLARGAARGMAGVRPGLSITSGDAAHEAYHL